jgi:hypothetical protein
LRAAYIGWTAHILKEVFTKRALRRSDQILQILTTLGLPPRLVANISFLTLARFI